MPSDENLSHNLINKYDVVRGRSLNHNQHFNARDFLK